MLALVLPVAQEAPAIAFEPGWDSSAWWLWSSISVVALLVGAVGPWLATRNYGTALFPLLNALAGLSYVYTFFIGLNLLMRHAPTTQLAFLIGAVHFVYAGVVWFVGSENWDSRWVPRIMAGAGAATVLVVGVSDGVTRAAAQLNVAVPQFMEFLGYACIAALVLGLVAFTRKG